MITRGKRREETRKERDKNVKKSTEPESWMWGNTDKKMTGVKVPSLKRKVTELAFHFSLKVTRPHT